MPFSQKSAPECVCYVEAMGTLAMPVSSVASSPAVQKFNSWVQVEDASRKMKLKLLRLL